MAAWQERTHSADVAEMLIMNHADPNIKNATGSTPLHNAAQVS
jgi:ankyrin repeat protein